MTDPQPSNTHTSCNSGIDQLLAIMKQLRDPQTGCAWDKEQSFATIAPYTIEEAYEVADAIERNNMDDLRDELGDLLLQVVYQAQIASEASHFVFADVVAAICDKMVRRHPHIFGDELASPGWEELKAAERSSQSADPSALADVASGLPALLRAEKLQRRAARTGFDWPDTDDVVSKIQEEIEEVQNATTPIHQEEEIGDLLFAVVNLARHLKVDPETALRKANTKFERRYRMMENYAEGNFSTLSLTQMEGLWQQAKLAEKQ